MRYAARKDANHNEITAALEAVGAHVFDCSKFGGGFPDVLVSYGELFLLEFKDGSKPKSAQKLTKAQKEFRKKFPVDVVANVQEALQAIGATEANDEAEWLAELERGYAQDRI